MSSTNLGNNAEDREKERVRVRYKWHNNMSETRVNELVFNINVHEFDI